MKLQIQDEVFHPAEDHSWLGSAHGTETGDPVTLDVSAFDAMDFANGFIPSGVVLGIITATGKYGPYDDAAMDGRQVARGHLLMTVAATGIGSGTEDVSGSMIRHGQVVEANLPTGHGLDAAGKADLTQFIYV